MTENKWTIDDYIEKLYPQRTGKLSDHFTVSSRQHIRDCDVTDELLYEGYFFMAHIVKAYGDQFLPIFERLHSEIERRNEKQSLINVAMEVSKINDFMQ